MPVALHAGCVATRRSDDRAFHAFDRGVHSPAQVARRASSSRRPHDPEVTTQPAIQPRQIVQSASSRSNSLQPPRRPRRVAHCSTGVPERWLAKCEFSRLCRPHADGGIPEKLRAVYRTGQRRTCRPDVRGSRPMALPSIFDCRRPSRQRYRGERDHERSSYTPTRAYAVGARHGKPGHVPCRNRTSTTSAPTNPQRLTNQLAGITPFVVVPAHHLHEVAVDHLRHPEVDH
jgi:hypothetical protein